MNAKKIGCVQHDCQECKDRERQSVPAGLQNIDRSVIEQALEWVEAQPEPRMLGAAKIITSLHEALAQPVLQELCKELAALGWQAIECPVCGSSAQGYPRQAAQPLSDEQIEEIENECYYQVEHGVQLDTKLFAKRVLATQLSKEPAAWQTFDGEGGYSYRSYYENEHYLEYWNNLNPRHLGWVELLYTKP